MSKKTAIPGKPENHLVVFQEKAIRRTWHNEEWWFAIVDVVSVLTDSVQPEGYVKDLRRRDKELAKGCGQIATPFGLKQKVVCSGSTARARRHKRHAEINGGLLWKFPIHASTSLARTGNLLIYNNGRTAQTARLIYSTKTCL